MDDQYEEEMLAKNKNNKDYNHNNIPSDPPASPHNNKHLGLSKSVDDSLDILQNAFGRMKQDITKYLNN